MNPGWQYRLNRTHAGLGWWTLGTAIWGLAFLFNAVREHPVWGLLAVVANNFCFIIGFAFIYVGVFRFFDQRERHAPLYSVSGGFVLVAAYFTLFDNNFDIRRGNFWAGAAVMSLLIAPGLWTNRKQAFQPIAKILAFIFLINAVFSWRSCFPRLLAKNCPTCSVHLSHLSPPIQMVLFSALMDFWIHYSCQPAFER